MPWQWSFWNSPWSGLAGDSSWETALVAPDLRDMLTGMMDSGPNNEEA